jgi:hypothetical protein
MHFSGMVEGDFPGIVTRPAAGWRSDDENVSKEDGSRTIFDGMLSVRRFRIVFPHSDEAWLVDSGWMWKRCGQFLTVYTIVATTVMKKR